MSFVPSCRTAVSDALSRCGFERKLSSNVRSSASAAAEVSGAPTATSEAFRSHRRSMMGIRQWFRPVTRRKCTLHEGTSLSAEREDSVRIVDETDMNLDDLGSMGIMFLTRAEQARPIF